jgi:transposase
MFVPPRHDPGRLQVDIGEALAVIAGEERKIHFFVMGLLHGDACVVEAYAAGTSDVLRWALRRLRVFPRDTAFDPLRQHRAFVCWDWIPPAATTRHYQQNSYGT